MDGGARGGAGFRYRAETRYVKEVAKGSRCLGKNVQWKRMRDRLTGSIAAPALGFYRFPAAQVDRSVSEIAEIAAIRS
jgi:hypothetical protein